MRFCAKICFRLEPGELYSIEYLYLTEADMATVALSIDLYQNMMKHTFESTWVVYERFILLKKLAARSSPQR